MLFKATERHVRAIAVNALEAAGVKMKQKDISVDRIGPKAGVSIDGMFGKHIGLRIVKQADVIWYVADKEPAKKTAWLDKYKNIEALVKSVDGVEVFGPRDAGVKAATTEKPKLAKDETTKKVEKKVEDRKKAVTKK